jgi:hypothetical protein
MGREWDRLPIRSGSARVDASPVRILVLWNAGRGVAPGDDESWARNQTDALRACSGITAMALHPVASAAVLHPQPCSWCLELRLAPESAPNEVVRDRPFAEFLGDLRLLGMHPRVLAIEGEL